MDLINRLSDLDQRIFLRFTRQCQKHSLTVSARIVSRTGDGYLQLLLPLGVCCADTTKGLLLLQMALLAFSVERAIYWILKNTLKRRRPPDALPWYSAVITASDEFSFPSGHTSGAFLLATLFYNYSPYIGLALFVWATSVGLSRVVLGVHFPADIFAGAILGTTIGSLIAIIL
jgi:undecaprenyl-diphosphatase